MFKKKKSLWRAKKASGVDKRSPPGSFKAHGGGDERVDPTMTIHRELPHFRTATPHDVPALYLRYGHAPPCNYDQNHAADGPPGTASTAHPSVAQQYLPSSRTNLLDFPHLDSSN